mmetsp:Transcript_34672/g.87743  ORF Transcript_34672/g.87743 Transcript_34672/m.87743 type:complete len:251 (+) Transcript_34672:2075-2827(+)
MPCTRSRNERSAPCDGLPAVRTTVPIFSDHVRCMPAAAEPSTGSTLVLMGAMGHLVLATWPAGSGGAAAASARQALSGSSTAAATALKLAATSSLARATKGAWKTSCHSSRGAPSTHSHTVSHEGLCAWATEPEPAGPRPRADKPEGAECWRLASMVAADGAAPPLPARCCLLLWGPAAMAAATASSTATSSWAVAQVRSSTGPWRVKSSATSLTHCMQARSTTPDDRATRRSCMALVALLHASTSGPPC